MKTFMQLVKEFDKIGYDLDFYIGEYGIGYYWEGGGRYGFEPTEPQIIDTLNILKTLEV